MNKAEAIKEVEKLDKEFKGIKDRVTELFQIGNGIILEENTGEYNKLKARDNEIEDLAFDLEQQFSL